MYPGNFRFSGEIQSSSQSASTNSPTSSALVSTVHTFLMKCCKRKSRNKNVKSGKRIWVAIISNFFYHPHRNARKRFQKRSKQVEWRVTYSTIQKEMSRARFITFFPDKQKREVSLEHSVQVCNTTLCRSVCAVMNTIQPCTNTERQHIHLAYIHTYTFG